MQEQIEKIIREAGGILMQHFGQVSSGRDKLFKGDVESEADLASEQCIVHGIQALYPEDYILSEEYPEKYLRGKTISEAGKDRLWIIDSLDGSRNFLRQTRSFAISIGLIENDVPKFGMAYLPPSNELFWGNSGGGAYLNDKRIYVSEENEINHIMMSFIFHDGRVDIEREKQIYMNAIVKDVWRMNFGNVVGDACRVACGRFEAGLWAGFFKWDTAAVGLILQEAGAKVTDLQGNPWYWGSDPQDIVAANPTLHAKIMREIVGV